MQRHRGRGREPPAFFNAVAGFGEADAFYMACRFGENTMNMTQRIVLGVGILIVDLVVFFLPLSAIFLMYVLIFNPPWFRTFLNNIEKSNGGA